MTAEQLAGSCLIDSSGNISGETGFSEKLNADSYYIQLVERGRQHKYRLYKGRTKYDSPPGVIPPVIFRVNENNWMLFSKLMKKIWKLPADMDWKNIHTCNNTYKKYDETGLWGDGRINYYWNLLDTDKKNNGNTDILEEYRQITRTLCSEFASIMAKHTGSKQFYCQQVFSPRIIEPGGKVADMHKDFRLPASTMNFVLFMTPAWGTNSLWLECENKRYKATQIPSDKGCWAMMFDARETFHGGFVNTTNISRVSFDCRILPVEQYSDKNIKKSYLGSEFSPGKAFFKEPIFPLMP